MKPKTKKILIIAAAAVAVAVIVWLVFFRKGNKNNTASIIRGLNIDEAGKTALTAMVDYINTSWDDEHKQAIADKAASTGRTLAQQTVIEALYSLYDSGQINASDYNAVLAQLTAL